MEATQKRPQNNTKRPQNDTKNNLKRKDVFSTRKKDLLRKKYDCLTGITYTTKIIQW